MSKAIKIGLVDDKAVNRSSVSDKIKQFEDLDFCFMAVNGNDCLEQFPAQYETYSVHVVNSALHHFLFLR